MYFIVVKFKTKPEYTEQFIELTTPFTQATRAEAGNLWFDWSRSVEDPSEFVLVEAFLDDDAAAMARTWRRAGHRVLAVDTLPRLLISGIPERLYIAYRIVAMERADRIHQLASVGVETLAWMDPHTDPGLELAMMSQLRGRR